jgi:hypothetical protein
MTSEGSRKKNSGKRQWPWEEVIKRHSKSMVSNYGKKGYLKVNAESLDFHITDRTVMRLIRLAYDRASPLAVFYPTVFTDIFAYAALECVYAGYEAQKRRKVLVIPRDLEPRAIYQDLQLRSGPVHKVTHPAGMVHRDGSVSAFSGTRGDPRVLFSSSPDTLPDDSIAPTIGSVIYEPAFNATRDDIRSILDWAGPQGIRSSIFIETDPYSQRLEAYDSMDVPVWGWDACALSLDFGTGRNSIPSYLPKTSDSRRRETWQRISNLARSVDYKVLHIPHSLVDNYLDQVWTIADSIGRMAKNQGIQGLVEAARLLYVGFYRLSHCVAPMDLLEMNAKHFWPFKTIRMHIGRLKSLERTLEAPQSLISAYNKAVSQLEEAYRLLSENTPPKAKSVIQCIDMAKRHSSSLLLVTPNHATKTAVERFIVEKKDIDVSRILRDFNTQIIIRKDLREASFYDVCVFCGVLPFYQAGLLTAGNAPRTAFLAHKCEIERVKKLIKAQRAWLSARFPYQRRVSVLSELIGIEESRISTTIPAPTAEERSVSITIGDEEFNLDDYDIGDNLTELLHEEEQVSVAEEALYLADDFRNVDSENDYQEDAVADAVNLRFSDNTSILLRPRSEIQAISRNGFAVEWKWASTIEKGDTVLILDRKALQSLEEHTVKILKRDPRLFKDVVRVEEWVQTLNEGMREFDHSFEDVLLLLKDEGSKITSPATIYHWTRGHVIGPQDLQNLKRIGRIYNDDYLQRRTREVAGSVKRIRGIHGKVKRMIERTIAQKAMGRRVKSGPLEENLNLYWEDFTDNLSFKRVAGTKTLTEIPITRIGVLSENGET